MARDQQSDDEQRRDKLLQRLLKTPPQPRPKRERDKGKPRLVGLAASAPSQESASLLLRRARFRQAVDTEAACPLRRATGPQRDPHHPPERRAVVVFEIHLSQITVQMGLADVVESAVDHPLEQAKNDFDRIGVVEAASADVLVSGMVDGAVPANSFPSRS